MKKLFLSLITLFVFTAGYSQFTKGNILLGGNTNVGLNFTTNKSKFNGATNTNYKTTSISLEPQAGYFVIDNLAVGTGLLISSSTQKDDGSSAKDINTTLAITPFARYYFDKFYAQVGFLAGSFKNKDTNGTGTTVETKYNLSGWSVGGGYAILLNESVALEPQIGYGANTQKINSVKTTDGGLFIRLGVYVYLSKLGK